MNDIWEADNMPSIWKLANIVPIPKSGKDHSEPLNYQHITLTSCVCKTMERIINAPLVWFLEPNGLCSNIQCVFRQGRSTLDHLVRFETFIRNAFTILTLNNNHIIYFFSVIFFFFHFIYMMTLNNNY